MKRRQRISLQLATALGLLLILLLVVDRLVPAWIENQLNRIEPHDAWVVSARAQRLHDSIAVADLHADPLLWKRDWVRADEKRGHTDLRRLLEGGVNLQVFSAVTKTPWGQNYDNNPADSDILGFLAAVQLWPSETWASPFARAVYQGRKLAQWERDAEGTFQLIRSRDELAAVRAAHAAGRPRLGGIFAIEGAHALEGNIAHLDTLDELGLRIIGLTHFFDNEAAGSLHGEEKGGLTDFGRRLVEEAGRRGMTIDVAHLSPQATREVLATSKRPVILSHGGFERICDQGRNLSDELMRELATHGALIGVGFWPGAVCDASPRGVVASIRYGIDLIGVEHIALGSDFDGSTLVTFDASELAILTQTMLDADFTEYEIRRVLGENAFEFFARALP